MSAATETVTAVRRRSFLPFVLGLALILLGTGLYFLGASIATSIPSKSLASLPVVGPMLKPAVPSLLGGNLPINAGAPDLRDINAHNSPSIALNPKDPSNLAVSNRIDTPRFSASLHYSTDGGATWNDTSFAIPQGEEDKPFAPDVAFGADGNLYVTYVTLAGAGNTPHAVWLATSIDKGKTLSAPVKVWGEKAFQVRLIADRTRPGRLYVTWLQASETGNFGFAATGNPINFARSDDGGLNWKGPVRVSPSSRERVLAPSMAQGGNGDLFVSYLDLKDDALDYSPSDGRGGEPYPGKWELVVARSADGGDSWKETTVDAAVAPIERFLAFLPAFPSISADPESENLYLAFHDARSGDPDVYLWTSTDGGVSFTKPLRVNDTELTDRRFQYLPRTAVAPGGRVDIVYYDRRSDPGDQMNDVSLQSSVDGGKSFGRHLKLNDRAFDSRIGFGSERDMPDLGSRLAIVSTYTRAMAVWTDTRSGTEASNKQDLARAVVEFKPSTTAANRMKIAGVAVAAAGLLVVVLRLVSGLRGRRRRAVEEDE